MTRGQAKILDDVEDAAETAERMIKAGNDPIASLTLFLTTMTKLLVKAAREDM